MAEPRRALVSVADKTGLDQFKALASAGWEIISASKLSVDPENATDFSEMLMLNSNVKGFHPHIMDGILSDRSKERHETWETDLIDLVVVNLCNFNPQNPDHDKIDINGISLIRAAAKNYAWVTVVVDPSDYGQVIREILNNGEVSPVTRGVLAFKAFSYTAKYDARIADWLKKKVIQDQPDSPDDIDQTLNQVHGDTPIDPTYELQAQESDIDQSEGASKGDEPQEPPRGIDSE